MNVLRDALQTHWTDIWISCLASQSRTYEQSPECIICLPYCLTAAQDRIYHPRHTLTSLREERLLKEEITRMDWWTAEVKAAARQKQLCSRASEYFKSPETLVYSIKICPKSRWPTVMTVRSAAVLQEFWFAYYSPQGLWTMWLLHELPGGFSGVWGQKGVVTCCYIKATTVCSR